MLFQLWILLRYDSWRGGREIVWKDRRVAWQIWKCEGWNLGPLIWLPFQLVSMKELWKNLRLGPEQFDSLDQPRDDEAMVGIGREDEVNTWLFRFTKIVPFLRRLCCLCQVEFEGCECVRLHAAHVHTKGAGEKQGDEMDWGRRGETRKGDWERLKKRPTETESVTNDDGKALAISIESWLGIDGNICPEVER